MPLSLSEAIAFNDRGIQKAKELGVQVSLAVVDEFGQVLQIDRMDGASLMTPDVAEAKAITALNFRRPTNRVAQDLQANPDRFRSLQQTVGFNILAAGGGVPVVREESLAGAMGVSGATAEQDEEIASYAVSA